MRQSIEDNPSDMCIYIYIHDITVIGFSDIVELDKHGILELDTNSRWICGDISD